MKMTLIAPAALAVVAGAAQAQTVANNTGAGSGDRAFNLGVRHTF